MNDQTGPGLEGRVTTPYVVILPGKHPSEELKQALNGYHTVISVRDSPDGLDPSIKILDLSLAHDVDLGYLLHEMRDTHYRPPEIVYLIERFIAGASWKHDARLLAQQNDQTILTAVLKHVPQDTLDAYLGPQSDDQDLLRLRHELDTVFARHPGVSQLYSGDELRLAIDLERICAANALKVYVDGRKPEPRSMSSVHSQLLDEVILRRKFFERLPAQYYPLESGSLVEALRNAYRDELKADPQEADIDAVKTALGAQRVAAIELELRGRTKIKILEYMRRVGLDDVLRTETRILGPSKNPVFSQTFTFPEAHLRTAVKVFDRRNASQAQAKLNEFTSEQRAIRWYERLGLLDPVNFTCDSVDGISVIVMNYLDSENLMDVMERAPPGTRYQLAHEVAMRGGKYHAFGPTALAKDAVPEEPRARARTFLDRITGDRAFFFPNIIRLLESQKIDILDKARLETDIRLGLEEPMRFLADAIDYDVTYVDINFRNWFVTREGDQLETPRYSIRSKRDFGTLKIVPGPVDIVTPFVAGNFVRDGREKIYAAHFDSYNKAVEEFNELVRRRALDPRHFLIKELHRDIQRGEDERREVARECHKFLSYHTAPESFQPKEALDSLMDLFKGREGIIKTASEYIDDIIWYDKNLRASHKPFRDQERYKLVCSTAEVKRGLVMSGFFAEYALDEGLTAAGLVEIQTTLRNAIEPLDRLAEREEFKRRRDDLHAARCALERLLACVDRLHPTIPRH